MTKVDFLQSLEHTRRNQLITEEQYNDLKDRCDNGEEIDVIKKELESIMVWG